MPIKVITTFGHPTLYSPFWVDVSQRTKKIGQHIFYNRAKGGSLEI